MIVGQRVVCWRVGTSRAGSTVVALAGARGGGGKLRQCLRSLKPVVVEYWAAGLTWAYGIGMISTRVCRAGLPAAGDRAVLARAAGPVLVGQGCGDTCAAARGGRSRCRP